MALASYTDLSAECTGWLQDSALAGKVDTFIALAEARFNRMIRAPQMEATAVYTLPSNADTFAIADMLAIKSVFALPDSGTKALYSLDQTTLANLKAEYGQGWPTSFAVSGNAIYFGPVPETDRRLKVVYYQAIPSLTALAPTNWLLQAHPDVYLWGVLTAAELYGWNDERVPLLKSAMDEAIAEINVSAAKKWSGAPLQPSSGMRQVGRVAF